MVKFIDSISGLVVIVLCISIGLAPFIPEPHVWEKLKMLSAGRLFAVADIFDLLLHGSPWVLLVLKLLRQFYKSAHAGAKKS